MVPIKKKVHIGVYIQTNFFTYEECNFLCLILKNKYKFKTNVVKSGKPDQWCVTIWKESLPRLA